MVKLLVAVTVAVVLAVAGSCTLLDDELPDDSCKADEDCFRAQGEYCHPSMKLCVPGDAGVDTP